MKWLVLKTKEGECPLGAVYDNLPEAYLAMRRVRQAFPGADIELFRQTRHESWERCWIWKAGG